MDKVVFISTNQNRYEDENNSYYTNASDYTSIVDISLTSGKSKTSINHENFLTSAEYDGLSINSMEDDKNSFDDEKKYLQQIQVILRLK